MVKDNISENLKDIEHKLLVMGKCLRARIYHHRNCVTLIASQSAMEITRNSEFRIKKKHIHLGNLFGDTKHDSFIVQLCFHIHMLYQYYLALIYHYNFIFQFGKHKRPPYVSQIDKELEDIFTHCSRKFLTIEVDKTNVLDKDYLISERNKYILGKTKANKESTKKSRVKSKKKYKAHKQVRTIKYKTYGLERE